MDFGDEPRLELLRSASRRFLEEECGIAHVRAMETDPVGYSPALLAAIARLGWTGLLIPRQFGGTGAGAEELSVVMQEAGRALLPGPLTSTAVIGALAVLSLPDEQIRQSLLDGIVRGDLPIADALFDEGQLDAEHVGTLALPTESGYSLSGEKRFVRHAAGCRYGVVLARMPADSAESRLAVLLVDLDGPGVSLTPLATVGSDGQCIVRLNEVAVPAAMVVATDADAEQLLDSMLRMARLSVIAQMVGGSRRLFELGHGHALSRRQFSKPIGAFQVIQHQLVDAYAQVECAQILLDQVSWMLANGIRCDQELWGAFVTAGDVYEEVSHTIGHIYGGYGLMKINDVQLYYRRAKALQLRYGDEDTALREIARSGYIRRQHRDADHQGAGECLYEA